MNASSESGECASLISRASVDVFEVACPVMGLVVPFVPQSLPCSRDSPSAPFRAQPACAGRSKPAFAASLRLRRGESASPFGTPCGTRTRGRERRWNLRGNLPILAEQSLAYRHGRDKRSGSHSTPRFAHPSPPVSGYFWWQALLVFRRRRREVAATRLQLQAVLVHF